VIFIRMGQAAWTPAEAGLAFVINPAPIRAHAKFPCRPGRR
jgi:hypothetical protein